MKSSEGRVQFLEYKESEQSNQFVKNDAVSSDYRERVVFAEKDLANASAEVKHLSTQRRVHKDLLDGVSAALAFHSTASQPCATADTKDRNKFLADKRAVNATTGNFREDMQS